MADHRFQWCGASSARLLHLDGDCNCDVAAAMRNPGGYGYLVSPDPTDVVFDSARRRERVSAGTFEVDTFTCFHCCRVTHVRPKMDPADMGGLCKVCMKLICNHCVGKGCDPFEKKLKRSEERDRIRRSYGF